MTTREDMKGSAAERRALSGNNLFENLGKPIQDLLMALQEDGKETDDKTMELLTHVTVKQLAKIFEMLNQGEDPETILAWLKRRARKNKNKAESGLDDKKALIKTGADRDPIAFYKELEAENAKKEEEWAEMEEERAQLRKARANERERKRKERDEAQKAADEALQAEGVSVQALKDNYDEKDRNALAQQFEKFANRESAFDNSEKDQDGEWWKRDKFRRDWEKNKGKGKKWRAPTEEDAKKGSYKNPVSEGEKRRREEFYSKPEEEWWQLPKYIQDYFTTKEDGRHWQAKTRAGGEQGKGLEQPADAPEIDRRVKWYEDNWWKQDKFLDDFAKNGKAGTAWQSADPTLTADKDWWKQPDFIVNWSKTMKPKRKMGNEEWWQQPDVIEDWIARGDNGCKWPSSDEKLARAKRAQETVADADTLRERKDWYEANWWKSPKYQIEWALKGRKGTQWFAKAKPVADANQAEKEPASDEEIGAREHWYRPIGSMWRAVSEEQGFLKKAQDFPCPKAEAMARDEWYRGNWWKAPEYAEDWAQHGDKGARWLAGSECAAEKNMGQEDMCAPDEKLRRDEWYRNAADNEWWKEPQFVEDWAQQGDDGAKWTADGRPNGVKNGGKEHPGTPEELDARRKWYDKNWWKAPSAMEDWRKNGDEGQKWKQDTNPDLEGVDPETKGEDGWWKKPDVIGDWFRFGDDGKRWLAENEGAAAAQQGQKKPAGDAEKAKREKWYKDNWWKAPQCQDDWAEKAGEGEKWLATDAEKAQEGAAQDSPTGAEEKEKREAWYQKFGDGDAWWKKPEYIEDYENHKEQAKKWTAANADAAQASRGKEMPASGPEKTKREKWYNDNWWKAPVYANDWAKGDEGEGKWKKDDPTDAEKDRREKWYAANRGTPASDEEVKKRDDWYQKHCPEASDEQKADREDWYTNQLPDEQKAARLQWLRQRADNEKRILQEELPEALAAINEGQAPTENQVQAIIAALERNREKKKDDFTDETGNAQPTGDDDDDEGPSLTKDEFLEAVAEVGFYVAPEKEELEMQAEEERQQQEKDEMTRQTEEVAYLAMDKEEELKKEVQEWQRTHKEAGEEWWQAPEYVEDYQVNPDDVEAKWRKEMEGGEDPAEPSECVRREKWYKDNWWKAPKFSNEWKNDGEDWWQKAERPAEDEDNEVVEDYDDEPNAEDDELAAREEWYRNAKCGERKKQDPTAAPDEWWKTPAMVENYHEGKEDWKKDKEGGEDDASPEEQEKREEWLKDNWWKQPKHIDDWKAAQAGKDVPWADTDSWKKTNPDGEQEAGANEQRKRDEWMKEMCGDVAPQVQAWEAKAKDAEEEEAKPKELTWAQKKKAEADAKKQDDTWNRGGGALAPPTKPLMPQPVEVAPAKVGWGEPVKVNANPYPADAQLVASTTTYIGPDGKPLQPGSDAWNRAHAQQGGGAQPQRVSGSPYPPEAQLVASTTTYIGADGQKLQPGSDAWNRAHAQQQAKIEAAAAPGGDAWNKSIAAQQAQAAAQAPGTAAAVPPPPAGVDGDAWNRAHKAALQAPPAPANVDADAWNRKHRDEALAAPPPANVDADAWNRNNKAAAEAMDNNAESQAWNRKHQEAAAAIPPPPANVDADAWNRVHKAQMAIPPPPPNVDADAWNRRHKAEAAPPPPQGVQQDAWNKKVQEAQQAMAQDPQSDAWNRKHAPPPPAAPAPQQIAQQDAWNKRVAPAAAPVAAPVAQQEAGRVGEACGA
eukprot:TRINITY_DN5295_c1_g1_i3.p2 TRINITY_DN5295_c1_g1~~TRINITY_DN5295_c1_g1_i3.p2  ORF type:complete len:1724 (+),score=863.55 TRINITY_DN5295_c1_g1_i3:155-5326(+)